MITVDPYGISHAIRPGYGEPEPVEPVFCYDPPEIRAICLGCTASVGFCMKNKACRLYGQSAAAKRKRRKRGKSG